jgi:hypothetical protein
VIATVPLENRWYPVLRRYLSQLGGRIKGLGGETGHGAGHGLGHGHEPSDHDHDEHGFGEHERHEEKRISYEGKVSGLIFDRFGDFEGFWLDTEDGKRSFRSREKEIEELVREAWIRRIAILVIVEKEEREEPQSIVLLRPPVDL